MRLHARKLHSRQPRPGDDRAHAGSLQARTELPDIGASGVCGCDIGQACRGSLAWSCFSCSQLSVTNSLSQRRVKFGRKLRASNSKSTVRCVARAAGGLACE